MAMLDSVAVFEARAKEMGLPDEDLARISLKGWNTFARLAFSCSYTPGQADDTSLMRLGAAITGVGANDPPEERMPIVRRLFFESYTLAAADLRARVDRRDEDAPRKLALPERSHRNREQAGRLSGISLEGEREVSHALVDLLVQMAEDNQLKYVRWEQCTKRDAELMGLKADPIWKPDAMGVVRATKTQVGLTANTGTDLLLRNALQRRSLAFDNCRLVDYGIFERWTDILLDAYLAAPIEGHAPISIEQLQRADLQLFKHAIRETRDGIRVRGDGSFPLEEALRIGFTLPEVRLHLMPVQGRGGGPGNKREASGSAREVTPEKLRRVVERPQGHADGQKRGRGKGKGGGKQGSKSSGKKEHYPVKMPSDLIGLDSSTQKERRFVLIIT